MTVAAQLSRNLALMIELDLATEIAAVRKAFADVTSVIDRDKLRSEIAELGEQAGVTNLWDDPDAAQIVTSNLSHRQAELAKLNGAESRIDDLEIMVELANEADDEQAAAEAKTELAALEKLVSELQVQTLLDGEWDEYPAVVTIRAGAGGVDAADFAEMLLRMYLRWAEKNNFVANVQGISYAEEAGIKSASFQVEGPHAFGIMSVEAGTHRLVRMSPFNSAGKRMTSFAAVEVVPLLPETSEIEVSETELKIDVFRATGPGGQSVNTTDSAVRMTHLPTGIVVSMQNEKSQIQNRAAALRVLKSRLLILKREQEAAQKKQLAGVITASWGDQMRSYVLAPFQMVKDLRSNHEENNPTAVFDGELSGFIDEGIRWRKRQQLGKA